LRWIGKCPSGVVEPTKKISGGDKMTSQSGCDLNTERPIVAGGPRKDWPMSASTSPTFKPRLQRREIKNLARVLFPVSVAPRSIAKPFTSSRTSNNPNHSFGAGISIDSQIDKHHYPIDPKGRCQEEPIGGKGIHFLNGNFITTI